MRHNIHITLDAGDFEYTGYCVSFLNTLRFLTGEFLEEIEQTYKKDVDLLVSIKQEYCITLTNIFLQVSQNLLGKTASVTELVGESLNEYEEISRLQAIKSSFALHHLYTVKTILSYLFGDSVQSVENAVLSESYSEGIFVANVSAAHKFYYSLSLLANYACVSKSKQEEYLNQIEANQEKMQLWAESAPQNFLHKLQLVSAEKYRVLGKIYEAMEMYELAISGAKHNQYIQEEALANELAAKLFLEWGKEKIAKVYMQDAYYCYSRWGAKAKVADLEKRYPQLLAPILQQTRSPLFTDETISYLGTLTSASSVTNSSSISVALDLASILKASQTISSVIELEKLLSSLLSIVIENAGADKCVLMLMESDNLLVRGLALLRLQNNQNSKVDFSSMLTNPQPVEESIDVPVGLINTVKRSLQPMVIIDATVHPQFINDPYFQQQQPKSILCTPILNQGKLLGIVYLENNLVTGAFSSDRVELLNLLCTQAAISLKNAQLYEREQQKSLLLEQALNNLQNAQLQIVQSEKMSALGNLVAGVAHEMNNPLGFISASIKQAKPAIADLTEHLKLYQETFLNKGEEIINHAEKIDLDYTLEDLPKIIDSMTMACDRLKNISTSLRTFSRADRDCKVPFNIHEGIDSTILILKHRLKASKQRPAIEVVTNYGNLPQIKCFPGQLNQVFMNIIANAIDALEESNSGHSFEEIKVNHNRITIATSINPNKTQVIISMKDNGKGMSESIKERIFDNLFTTKTVGKGTGLGLAIARQIVVEKHGGTINVNSVADRGTEFTIALPVV